jgi:hypothetical protein
MPKGYRPTEDPNWRHEHAPTGKVRQCSRPGCREYFPIYCHSGRKRYCDICIRAVRRDRDREAKRRVRAWDARWELADLAASIRSLARAGLTTSQLQQAVADWHAMKRRQRIAARRIIARRRKRANRRLSADQLYTVKEHGTEMEADNVDVRNVREPHPEQSRPRPSAPVPRGDMRQPGEATTDEPASEIGPGSREGGQGAAMSKPDPNAWLPVIRATDLPCCRDSPDGIACPQHRQAQQIRWYWRAPKYTPSGEE